MEIKKTVCFEYDKRAHTMLQTAAAVLFVPLCVWFSRVNSQDQRQTPREEWMKENMQHIRTYETDWRIKVADKSRFWVILKCQYFSRAFEFSIAHFSWLRPIVVCAPVRYVFTNNNKQTKCKGSPTHIRTHSLSVVFAPRRVFFAQQSQKVNVRKLLFIIIYI